MIKACACKHPAQDKEHGHAMRVHNPMKLGGWRCSVCGDTKETRNKAVAIAMAKESNED